MHSQEHSRCNLDKQPAEPVHSLDSSDSLDYLCPRQDSHSKAGLPAAHIPALDTPDYSRSKEDFPALVGNSEALAAKMEKPAPAAEVEDKVYRQAGIAARPMDKQGAPLLHVRDKRFAG
jgi:hypothetical protein